MNVDINSKIKTQFGREAEKYVSSQVHADPDDLQFIQDFINPQSSWVALDIATGGGHLSFTLASKIKKVYATDITEQMLTQVTKQIETKKITNIETKLEDAHKLSFKSDTFDLVASRLAPHHFHDITKALQEMKRVTKKGGFIFIQDTLGPENPDAKDFFNKIETMRDPSHVRVLSESEWLDLFKNTGLNLIDTGKRQKSWPLRWWTERMSTPEPIVKEIIALLEENKNSFRYSIKIDKDENNEFVIRPFNGYFLVQKPEESNLLTDFKFKEF